MGKLTGESSRLVSMIRPDNLLSFGPKAYGLELESLNVLIGPNGSGKSNLLDAISLLRASPTDLRPVIARGGGVQEWIWKGAANAPAGIAVHFALQEDGRQRVIEHQITFAKESQMFRLIDEAIWDPAGDGIESTLFNMFGRMPKKKPAITYRRNGKSIVRALADLDSGRSVLAQMRDPEAFPEIGYIAECYGQIRLYREWAFGRNTVFREPQRADLRTDRLEEDFSNLGLFLNRLRRQPKAKAALLKGLRDLYDGLTDFDVSVEGGTVQIFFTEGDFAIPATRLSDGSLRYLALLAILCDPVPPPLIGIEEPELGLHPDLLPKVADLLVEASQRTQLIVTTHSDVLVDALTEHPSAIVVCEKHEGQTTMNRLDQDELAVWLKKYRLGELWTRGQLGGNRW
jgi:predicted ATPase